MAIATKKDLIFLLQKDSIRKSSTTQKNREGVYTGFHRKRKIGMNFKSTRRYPIS